MGFWNRPRLLMLAIAILAAVFLASPYWMLWRLRRAAERNDLVTIEQLIDFPAVRAAMKENASSAMRDKLSAVLANKMAASLLGNTMGPGYLDKLIDEQITPAAAARLIQGARIEHAWFGSPWSFHFETGLLKGTARFRGFGWQVIWIGLPGS